MPAKTHADKTAPIAATTEVQAATTEVQAAIAVGRGGVYLSDINDPNAVVATAPQAALSPEIAAFQASAEARPGIVERFLSLWTPASEAKTTTRRTAKKAA